ncbi:MAG: hypothetical protein IPG00_09945 [Saprospiraceae bacterium]|nr:hypothetical protein [Saprospiraceae bacterium]
MIIQMICSSFNTLLKVIALIDCIWTIRPDKTVLDMGNFRYKLCGFAIEMLVPTAIRSSVFRSLWTLSENINIDGINLAYAETYEKYINLGKTAKIQSNLRLSP